MHFSWNDDDKIGVWSIFFIDIANVIIFNSFAWCSAIVQLESKRNANHCTASMNVYNFFSFLSRIVRQKNFISMSFKLSYIINYIFILIFKALNHCQAEPCDEHNSKILNKINLWIHNFTHQIVKSFAIDKNVVIKIRRKKERTFATSIFRK